MQNAYCGKSALYVRKVPPVNCLLFAYLAKVYYFVISVSMEILTSVSLYVISQTDARLSQPGIGFKGRHIFM